VASVRWNRRKWIRGGATAMWLQRLADIRAYVILIRLLRLVMIQAISGNVTETDNFSSHAILESRFVDSTLDNAE
jgi:hypothetical protein